MMLVSGSPYTNANKELRKEYEDRGLTVVTAKDRETIYGMKESLFQKEQNICQPMRESFLVCSTLHMK